MPSYQFNLHFTTDEFVAYYRGTAKNVVARATNGQTVQFPASLLQKFVSTEGVHGNFVLTCDEHNKVIDLKRAGD